MNEVIEKTDEMISRMESFLKEAKDSNQSISKDLTNVISNLVKAGKDFKNHVKGDI